MSPTKYGDSTRKIRTFGTKESKLGLIQQETRTVGYMGQPTKLGFNKATKPWRFDNKTWGFSK